ncbi:MAG: hypothetical protein ACRD90_00250 [Nitrosopumilaceae archaeon]
MNHKYVVIVILVLLFGATLAVSAEYSPIEKINSTDSLKIKDNVVIIKQSDFTTPYET